MAGNHGNTQTKATPSPGPRRPRRSLRSLTASREMAPMALAVRPTASRQTTRERSAPASTEGNALPMRLLAGHAHLTVCSLCGKAKTKTNRVEHWCNRCLANGVRTDTKEQPKKRMRSNRRFVLRSSPKDVRWMVPPFSPWFKGKPRRKNTLFSVSFGTIDGPGR